MKRLLFISTCAVLLFNSCVKQEVAEPAFEVAVEKLTYKLGDTVKFNFSGYADYLSVYTGEAGRRYEYKDRTRAEGKVLISMNANLRNATGENVFSVFATTELNPLREKEDVLNANWTDISNRFTIPTQNTGTGVPIGVDVDLTDLTVKDKPLYLALRMKSTNNTVTVQPRITITSLSLTNNLPDGTKLALGTATNLGWKNVNVSNEAYAWIIVGGLYTNAPAKNTGDTENWVVSKPIIVDEMVRDYPVAIKDIIAVMPEQYQIKYTAKGTYKVAFIGLNSRNLESKETVKEFEITVE
jgi:hypothetical protein